MKYKAALHNLGCKVNGYELEAMSQMLEENGYEIVDFAPGADIYIINTCTVTNIADRKSRQMLHKAKKMNPEAIVVAAGCYAQADPETMEKDDAIDIVIGNNRKNELIAILQDHYKGMEKKMDLIEIGETQEFEEMHLSKMTDHTRAFLKVQDGCNQFCSYCIIPFARGRVRSRRKADVVEEVERLAEAGCQEVVLTGIHLASYGSERGEDDLLSLLQAVHQVAGIRRIRMGSLEPGIITEEFAAALGKMPKICPHFHLSLQSGCDATLKRMNRKYTSSEFKEKCKILRKVYDRPALTTDVIVGFPGETEVDFEESYAFLDEIAFYETHIFKYSKRAGTKAAAMEGQVAENIKGIRSCRLISLGEKKKKSYLETFLGQKLEVLLEEEMDLAGVGKVITGYTREYVRVAFCDLSLRANSLVMGKSHEITDEGILLVR